MRSHVIMFRVEPLAAEGSPCRSDLELLLVLDERSNWAFNGLIGRKPDMQHHATVEALPMGSEGDWVVWCRGDPQREVTSGISSSADQAVSRSGDHLVGRIMIADHLHPQVTASVLPAADCLASEPTAPRRGASSLPKSG